MNRRRVFALLLLGIAPLSCQNDVTPPPPPEFVFRVVVRDGMGTPVPGVVVAAWNKLPPGIPPWETGPAFGARVQATTTVRCDVPQRCHLTLSMLDLEGRLLRTLIDRDGAAGSYSFVWSVPVARHAAYRCRLVAQDSTGSALYRDSIVVSSWTPEHAANTLGVTSSDGVFEIRDRTFFPSLFDLGQQVMTSVVGESTGTFAWSDTVVIEVANPAAGATYERVLTKGPNTFTFSWPPTGPEAKTRARPLELVPTPSIDAPAEPDSIPVGPPRRFRLHQNSPNPFD